MEISSGGGNGVVSTARVPSYAISPFCPTSADGLRHAEPCSRIDCSFGLVWLAEAAGFEPLHLELRPAELHRANGELGRRSASETLFKSAARALAIRDAQVRVPPPGLRVWVNFDSEMQRFESSRPSLRVRSLRVKSDGATLDWRGQGMSDRALPDRRKGCVCAVSLNIRSISTVLSRRLFFPIARRQSLRSLMPWARRCCYARLMQDFTRQHADRASAPAHRHRRSGEQVLHARQQ